MDRKDLFVVSGNGDVFAADDNVVAIGSGAGYALAAARAMSRHSELNAEQICREALQLAGDICIYTNDRLTILTFEEEGEDDADRIAE